MELFEILFILVFILFPILEQVLRRRRQAPGESGEPGPVEMDTEPGSVDPPSREREPVQAEDMVPDDLWAVLTGEQRPREGGTEDAGSRPWSMEPEPAREPDPEWEPEREPEWEPEREPTPWVVDDQEEVVAPVSLERYGPEAYSLETLDQKAASLERPVPPPQVRGRAFRESMERPPPRPPRSRTALARALAHPEGLRQAFVLSEVLAPPKGLE